MAFVDHLWTFVLKKTNRRNLISSSLQSLSFISKHHEFAHSTLLLSGGECYSH
jgi:hypothetical protein